MASNPPFNMMEDQSDADFFDNLVDDDFTGPTGLVSSSAAASSLKSAEESDSDESKAFANLSIEEEVKGGSENLVCVGAGLSGPPAANSLAALLDASNEVNVSNSEATRSEDVLDSGESKVSGGGSSKSWVKEVGWGSFYMDSSMPNGNDNTFGSYSDFFNDLGGGSEDFPAKVEEKSSLENEVSGGLDNAVNHAPDGARIDGGSSVVEGVNRQDVQNSEHWENAYPGWKYDVSTGQWYQVDGYDATASVQQGSFDGYMASGWAADGKTEVNYFQQVPQSVVGTVSETGMTESVSNWNHVSQGNNDGYPEHMVFDPQYPGWYYDKITQEWKSLDSYTASALSTSVHSYDQQNQNGFTSSGAYSQNSNSTYDKFGEVENYVSQGYNSVAQHGSWGESSSNYSQQGLNVWQPETAANTDAASNFGGNQQLENFYDPNLTANNHVGQHNSFNSMGAVTAYENAGQGHAEANGFIGSQSIGNFGQQFNQGDLKQSEQMSFSNDYHSSQKMVSVAQQPFQNNQQFSYCPNRSSAGRPSHALVTFGFGGKLIVMKDSSLGNSPFGNQDAVAGSSISVLNLMEVVSGSINNSSKSGGVVCNYFSALSQQSFPGPLVGGSVGSKELNKWIDERIANCESTDTNYKRSQALKLLLSLLKIASQHYGKLRSPFGTDASSRESDSPESAVVKLFASVKRNGTQLGEYGALNHCLQSVPSEGQIRATASEVQNLLVSGRKKEALQCAQDGQLWGPALVLASQLGDKFYVDTVKQMALRQLVAGSPLRTLCLLIAGQPADVFSDETTAVAALPGALGQFQQPVQMGVAGMLDDWEENLAIITANRTKDDELVIVHLGDCLWKERSEITAAHICYLVAEANFESYSDKARLCLVGADHWKYPRTYATPEAIQRTELYEYSKVLGNSQFILLPFQPYKLMYAYMLAEVGKVADSLKYCQAVLKSLKTARTPEAETWRQLVSSLEERIRGHQQGGYTANLAPAKLVGKLLNFFDSTAHRVVGGLPPPAPSTSQSGIQVAEYYQQTMASRVSASQSTMAMSSLMPSASMEPISEWATDSNRMTMHNRSVSEPDFGRSPRQVDSSKEETSSSAQGKTSGSVGASRFARFGFGSQLLQKTVGLVLRPRSDRQAKLGETNKFYYDEKLKRWVEEGAEVPAEEASLPPPPTTVGFQNGTSDYNLKSAMKNDGSTADGSPTFKSPAPVDNASGIPPIPSSSNQFSARGRTGVRARYVDTFNKGGGNSANLMQSPSIPPVKKPVVAANAKFFVPTAAPTGQYSMEAIAENVQDDTATAVNPASASTRNDSLQSPQSSSSITMQKYPSMDNMARRELMNGKGALPSHSRRTASWSGSFGDSFSPPGRMEPRPLGGETLGTSPAPGIHNDPSVMRTPINGNNFGDDLHEVEL